MRMMVTAFSAFDDLGYFFKYHCARKLLNWVLFREIEARSPQYILSTSRPLLFIESTFVEFALVIKDMSADNEREHELWSDHVTPFLARKYACATRARHGILLTLYDQSPSSQPQCHSNQPPS